MRIKNKMTPSLRGVLSRSNLFLKCRSGVPQKGGIPQLLNDLRVPLFLLLLLPALLPAQVSTNGQIFAGTRGSGVFRSEQSTSALPPSIVSFTPTSGPIGTTVTITGTNFNTTAANNVVYFGAVKGTITSATSNELRVTVPAGATYTPMTVTDITNGLTAYSNASFIVTFAGGGSISSSSFSATVGFTTGGAPEHITIADFNGDGKPDLVTTNTGSKTISVFRNTSSIGSITSSSFANKLDFATDSLPNDVLTGDLDGDGKPDVVAVNSGSNSVSMFRNTSTIGSISFSNKLDFATGNFPALLAIGDLDGDGKPEVVVPNIYNNTFSVFRNTSTVGSISFENKMDFAAGNTPIGIAINDFDGDGKPDIAISEYGSNTLTVFRNKSTIGNISFAAGLNFASNNSPANIAVGDLNGDGKSDLAVINKGSGSVSMFRNTSTIGSITFAAYVDYTGVGNQPYDNVISDLNGDGKPDLAVSNSESNTVSVFQNTSTLGSISFSDKVDFAIGGTSWGVAIGDLDGDGKPDLAATNNSSNTVSILWNTIGGSNEAPVAPQNLTAIAGNGQVTLKWSQNAEANILRYRIFKGTTFGAETLYDSTKITFNVPDTTKIIKGLTNGTAYYFRITAVDSSGLESGYSNEISIIPVMPPAFLFEDNFTSSLGTPLLNNGWLLSNGIANPLTVNSPGLSFPGYGSSGIGNAVSLADTGQDFYRTFSPVNSGSVYLAFMSSISSAKTGDYFIALSPSSRQTNYYARLHVKAVGSGYTVGISKINEVTGGAQYGSTVFSFNTTYLFIVKYTFSATSTDPISVYVFQNGADLTSEPGAAEIANYTASNLDADDFGYVTLRQGRFGLAPTLVIDGIRIATSWTEVIRHASMYVTFRLNTASCPDTLHPNSFVQIRGSNTALGTWTQNSPAMMTNIGGDYWTATVRMEPNDSIEYKFCALVAPGVPVDNSSGWETSMTTFSGNRILRTGTADTVLPLAFFIPGVATTYPQTWKPYRESDSVDVWFRVNMQYFSSINPSTMGVGLRGSNSPLSWSTSVLLTPEVTGQSRSYDGSMFYSGVVRFPLSSLQTDCLYKFVILDSKSPTANCIWWERPSAASDVETGLDNNRILPANTVPIDTTLVWRFWENKDFPTGAVPLTGEYTVDASTALLMHMNETSGTTVGDMTTNSNNGTTTETTIIDGRFGKARYFASSDKISINDSPNLDFSSNDFTVECWIKTTSNILHNALIEKLNATSGFGLDYHGSDLHGIINLRISSGGVSNEVWSHDTVNDGRWHHIAGVRRNNRISVYVDGVLQNDVDASKIGSITCVSTPIFIGGTIGSLDEVRLSWKARIPQEFNLQLPPANLTATPSGSTVTLNWQNGGGIVPLMRYNVYRGTDSTNVILIGSTAQLLYTNSGLAQGTYYYRVSAVDSTGFEGAKSYTVRAATSGSSIASSDTMYMIPRTTVAPVIDGIVDPIWNTVDYTWQQYYSCIGYTPPDNWADFSCWSKLLWDDKNIYGLFYVCDNVIDSVSTIGWEMDGIYIYTDPTVSHNTVTPLAYPKLQFAMKLPQKTDSVERAYGHGLQYRWLPESPSIQQGGPSGYYVEFKLSLDSLGIAAAAGTKFSLELQTDDNDGTGRRHISKWWNSTGIDDEWLNTFHWGTAILSDRTVDGTYVYEFLKTPVAPTIDGNVDDLWNKAYQVTMNARNAIGSYPTDPQDQSWRFYGLYDDNYLYGLFTVYDNVVDTRLQSIDWQMDAVEIYTDPENTHTAGASTSGITPPRHQFCLRPPQNIDSVQSALGHGLEYKWRRLPGTPNDSVFNTCSGYSVEFKLSLASLGISNAANTKISFDLVTEDNDGNLRLHRTNWWSTSDDQWYQTLNWGNAILSSKQITVTSPVTTPPAAPTNLIAITGNGQVILKWSKNTETDFLRYRIYFGTSVYQRLKIDSTTGNNTDTVKTVFGLTNGVLYYFRVTAVNSSGVESGLSNLTTAKPIGQTIVNVPSDMSGSEGSLNAAVQTAVTAGTLSSTTFQLESHGHYILTGPITVPAGEHLTIIAPDPGTTQATAPPRIVLSANNGESWRYNFDCIGDITLKNVWLLYANTAGVQQNASLDIDNDNTDNKNVGYFEGVIFDYAPVRGSVELRAKHFTGTFKNCYWRNNIDPLSQYYGRAVTWPYQSTEWHTDSLSFVNCTFANLGYVLMQEAPEYTDYVWFNHCTFLNTMMFSLESGWWYWLSVTNSIYVNMFMLGDMASNRVIMNSGDSPYGGALNIDSLSNAANFGVSVPFTEGQRHILFANNSYFIEQWLRDYWASNPYSDTASANNKPQAQPLMSTKTKTFFKNKTAWPYISLGNLYDNINPGFILAPTNQTTIKAFLLERWRGSTINVDWSYDIQSDLNGIWPMNENLSYTNSSLQLAGINGFPLGDLYHWWPAQYDSWKAQEESEDARISQWLSTGVEQGPVAGERILRLAPYAVSGQYLNDQIAADTIANGKLPDRVYVLQRGGIYRVNASISNYNWTLRIRANDSTSTQKPVIFPYQTIGQLIDVNGNVELKNLILSGYHEPTDTNLRNVQSTLVRIPSTTSGWKITIDGCILSNNIGHHIRTDGAASVIKTTNTTFANMGYLGKTNLGAGRGIDLRDQACDSLIVQNCTFTNSQDRIIRHLGMAAPSLTNPLRIFVFDHNTIVNGMSYHGLFALGNVSQKATITNNLFLDAFALGNDTDYTRQLSPEFASSGEKDAYGRNRMTWIYSEPNQTAQWTVSNNYYSISDSGQTFFNQYTSAGVTGAGSPLTWHINSRLGPDSLNAFTKVNIKPLKVPALMTKLLRWYRSPSGGNKSKNTPANWVFGDLNIHPYADPYDFDRKSYNWLQDSLDCSYYSSIALSSTDGKIVGDQRWKFLGTAISPMTPQNLTATAVAASQINLSWSSAGEAVLRYRIYRSIDSVNFTKIDSTTNTSYADTTLTMLTTYWYKITALFNTGEVSDFSVPAKATTIRSVPWIMSIGLPNSPQRGDVKIPFTLRVPVGAIANLASAYSIDSGKTFISSNNVIGVMTNISIDKIDTLIWKTNLDLPNFESRAMKFRITPSDQSGDGVPITSELFTVDNKVPVFSGISSAIWDTNKIRLSWQSAVDISTPLTYRIYRSTTSGLFDFSWSYQSTVNTLALIPGLQPLEQNYFVVHAEDALGNTDTNTMIRSIRICPPADFNGDMKIDGQDLAIFAWAWRNKNLSAADLGPATGNPPYYISQRDGKIDLQDLGIFAQMWDWSIDHPNASIATRVKNREEKGGSSLVESITIQPRSSVAVSLSFPEMSTAQTMEYIVSVNGKKIQIDSIYALSSAGAIELKNINMANGSGWVLVTNLENSNENAGAKKYKVSLTALGKLFKDTVSIRINGFDNNAQLKYQVEKLVIFNPERLLPETFALHQNYPNPFNPSTTIEYELPDPAKVNLKIFNMLGQEIETLVDGEISAGYQRTTWNATISSGVYFYRMEAVSSADPGKRFIDVKKMILMR